MKEYGIVKEVFLTEDELMLGFRIDLNGYEVIIIEKQNDINTKIYREDKVIIKSSIIDNKVIYKIEGLVGEV